MFFIPIKTCFSFSAIFALGSKIHAEGMSWVGIEHTKRQQSFAFAARFSRFCESAFRLSTTLRKVVVIPCMVKTICYLKIFNPVIKFITVFMVDNFMALKRSTKVLLHDMTMFKNFFAVNTKSFIPISKKPSFSFVNMERIAVKKPSKIMLITPASRFRIVLTILNITFHVTNVLNLFRKVKEGCNHGI